MYKTPRIKGEDFAKEIHFAVPKILFVNEEYMDLSAEAKLMYSFFLDRAKLSSIRGYENDEGEPFIFYKVEHLQKMLGCSDRKIAKLKKELLDHGLVDIEVTGRAHRMFIHHLSYSGYTASDLEVFEAPEIDETKWTSEERALLSKNNGKRSEEDDIEDNIQPETAKFHDDPKNLRLVVKQRQINNLDFEDSRRPEKSSGQTRKKGGSSKSNRVIDIRLDDYTDHTSDIFKKNILSVEAPVDELEQMELDLFWYDLNEADLYHPHIFATLRTLSNSEKPQMLHRVLQNAMKDILHGNFNVQADYKPYEAQIKDILDQINWYQDPGLSEAVKFAIIRAFRMGEKEIINSKEAYYFKAVSRAILEYLAKHYDLGKGAVTDDEIQIPLWEEL